MRHRDTARKPRRQPQDGAERGRRSQTDLGHTYAVVTVTERISLTPKGERMADLILGKRD